MTIFGGRIILVCTWIRVHWKTSLMTSSLLILLVLLGWFVRWEVCGRTTLFCKVLLARFVENIPQHSWVVSIKFFLQLVHQYNSWNSCSVYVDITFDAPTVQSENYFYKNGVYWWENLPSKENYDIHIYPSPRSGRKWHKVNFKRSLTGLNSEFSFSQTSCLTKAEEPSLPYYLPIAGGRITGFIPFPRVLGLCEMQSLSSKIWTHVAVSISYDDNHDTMKTTISL